MSSPYREPAPGSADSAHPEGEPLYAAPVEWYSPGDGVSYGPIVGGVLVRAVRGGIVLLPDRTLERRLTGHIVRKAYDANGKWTDCRCAVYELRIAYGQSASDGWETVRPFWGAVRTPDSGA